MNQAIAETLTPEQRAEMLRRDEEARIRFEIEQANYRRRRLLDDAGVPPLHAKPVEMESSPNEWRKAHDLLVSRIGTGMCVAIIGNRGTGKTQLAVRVIAESCWKDRTSKYTTALDLFLDIREASKQPGGSEKQTIARYCDYKLLVIDEIQVRGETTFENNQLTHIVDARYYGGVDTLLIGNLTSQGLRDSLGASIVDRIVEKGGIVECNWPSFRRNPVLD